MIMSIFKKITFIYIISSCFLVAYGKDFTLHPQYLQSQKNPMSIAIFKDYERFINKFSKKALKTKLQAVNSYINSVNSIDDNPHDAMIDRWSTRGEFLSKGGGDCEDYAITKYYTLKDMGIEDKNLCLIVVKEVYSGYDHMVLGYWSDTNSSPLILDNLSFKVLPFTKRVDLTPSYCMNEQGYFKVNKKGKRTKAKILFKAYESMLQRNKNEHLWK